MTGTSANRKAVSVQLSALSLTLLAALAVATVPGCGIDAAKILEIQGKQQNALITSVTDKVNWENVAATLSSTLSDPELTIEVLYVQGAVISIRTRGITSTVGINAMGASSAPNDAETAKRINEILKSNLPASVKEQLIADLLKQVLQPPGEKATAENAKNAEKAKSDTTGNTTEVKTEPGAAAPGGEPSPAGD